MATTRHLAEEVQRDLSAAWAEQAATAVVDSLVDTAAEAAQRNLAAMAGSIIKSMLVLACSRGYHNLEVAAEEARLAQEERDREAKAFLDEFEKEHAREMEAEEAAKIKKMRGRRRVVAAAATIGFARMASNQASVASVAGSTAKPRRAGGARRKGGMEQVTQPTILSFVPC